MLFEFYSYGLFCEQVAKWLIQVQPNLGVSIIRAYKYYIIIKNLYILPK